MWLAGEPHPALFQRPASLLMVTGRAGSHNIIPAVSAAQMAGKYMVDRQFSRVLSTILTGKMIPPEDFTAG